MKHEQLLKYAMTGISAQIDKEQKLADEGNQIALARLEKLHKDFDTVAEMAYMEETGHAR